MKKYLLYSSVLLHIGILAWLISILIRTHHSTEALTEAYNNPRTGVVKESKVLWIDGLKFQSYAIELDGEKFFTSDIFNEAFSVGDKVNLVFQESRYGEESSLTVMINGKIEQKND